MAADELCVGRHLPEVNVRYAVPIEIEQPIEYKCQYLINGLFYDTLPHYSKYTLMNNSSMNLPAYPIQTSKHLQALSIFNFLVQIKFIDFE